MNLGGLGATNGDPVDFTWVSPNLIAAFTAHQPLPVPSLLPWLLLLGLLLLKPNRNASAWLIWLPLAGVLLVAELAMNLPAGLDALSDVVASLAFGLAAVWLLASYLRRPHRLVTFLWVLFALAGFSLVIFMRKEILQWGEFQNEDPLPSMFIVGLGVLATAAALSLGGWLCRRCFRPLKYGLCLLASLLICWLAMTVPFFVAASLASGGPSHAWSEFFTPVLCVSLINFGLLLPFLILSSVNPFFRARLQTLLHLEPAAPLISCLNTSNPGNPESL